MKLIWQFFVRNAVISHLGFSVWVMAAHLCQLEVPAKPRSALQSSLESQNCKNSLEDPGRSGPHTIDCWEKKRQQTFKTIQYSGFTSCVQMTLTLSVLAAWTRYQSFVKENNLQQQITESEWNHGDFKHLRMISTIDWKALFFSNFVYFGMESKSIVMGVGRLTSLCHFVLLLVRLNVSMAIVQGFTVSWFQ